MSGIEYLGCTFECRKDMFEAMFIELTEEPGSLIVVDCTVLTGRCGFVRGLEIFQTVYQALRRKEELFVIRQ